MNLKLLCLMGVLTKGSIASGNNFGHHGREPTDYTDISGAGATFGATAFSSMAAAFMAFRRQYRKVMLRYKSVGSTAGFKMLNEDTFSDCNIDFSLSNDPMVVTHDYSDKFLYIPIFIGATVVGYNLPNRSSLTLSREAIAGIFNGHIQWWNTYAISKHNTITPLPKKRIRTVVRKHSSGTTRGFTYALDKFSKNWTQGTFSDANSWKEGVAAYYAKGSVGVVGILSSVEYTIGYLPCAVAHTSGISIAMLINRNGHRVWPHNDILRHTVESAVQIQPDQRPTLNKTIDASGNDSYPLVSVLFMVIRAKSSCDCDRATELARFVEWFMTTSEANDIIKMFNYTEFSKSFNNRVRDYMFRNYACQGQSVYQLVLTQKSKEYASTQAWRVPVAAISSVIGVAMALILCYLIQKQMKLARAIQSQEWLIPASDIRFVKVQKHTLWTSEAATHQAFADKTDLAHTGDALEKASIGGSSIDENDDVVGRWKETLVVLKEIDLGDIGTLYRDTMATVLWMRNNVKHTNVQLFYGLTTYSDQIYLVREYSSKGILKDILTNEKFSFDNNFKFSLIQDVACGMLYLHSRDIVHGYLRAAACAVDQKWTVKIKDWEFTKLLEVQNLQPPLTPPCVALYDQNEHPNLFAKELFWTAPEFLLCDRVMTTKQSDLYSFGVLIQEVFTREDPYSEMADELQPQDIVEEIKKASLRPMIRPETPSLVRSILTRLWDEEPLKRPSFSQLLKILSNAHPSKKTVLDTMMEALESYVLQLEQKVDSQVDELAEAITSVQNILHDILPPTIADQITEGQTVQAKSYTQASLLVARAVNFNEIVATYHPSAIMELVNDMYLVMDVIAERHDIKKIESIADTVIYISGVPNESIQTHAEECCNMALDFQSAFNKFHMRGRKRTQLEMRIAIHTGSVVAAVVGLKVPHFAVFGDTFTLACLLESKSATGKILVSESTCELLKNKMSGWKILYKEKVCVENNLLSIQEQGLVELKTYFLVGKEGYNPTFAQMVIKTYCSFPGNSVCLKPGLVRSSSSDYSDRKGTSTSASSQDI